MEVSGVLEAAYPQHGLNWVISVPFRWVQLVFGGVAAVGSQMSRLQPYRNYVSRPHRKFWQVLTISLKSFSLLHDKHTTMAGPYKSKPFRGKKPIKDLREFKSREIKKSLVQRARIRKNYFKLLEKEGEAPAPEEEPQENESASEDSGSDTESKSAVKKRAPLPPQTMSYRQPPPPKKKPMNFHEKARMAKERKTEQRQKKLSEIQARREALERETKKREQRKESLAKRTKSGQPLMGPRINSLLDKIKENSEK